MKQKISVIKVANSLAITTAVFYLACIIAVWIIPEFTAKIGNYLLHGIDITKLAMERSSGYSMLSLLSGTIFGWLAGALFAWVYNKI